MYGDNAYSCSHLVVLDLVIVTFEFPCSFALRLIILKEHLDAFWFGCINQVA